jgi:hypothetical protein
LYLQATATGFGKLGWKKMAVMRKDVEMRGEPSNEFSGPNNPAPSPPPVTQDASCPICLNET